MPQYTGSGEAIHKVINDLDRSNPFFCTSILKKELSEISLFGIAQSISKGDVLIWYLPSDSGEKDSYGVLLLKAVKFTLHS